VAKTRSAVPIDILGERSRIFQRQQTDCILQHNSKVPNDPHLGNLRSSSFRLAVEPKAEALCIGSKALRWQNPRTQNHRTSPYREYDEPAFEVNSPSLTQTVVTRLKFEMRGWRVYAVGACSTFTDLSNPLCQLHLHRYCTVPNTNPSRPELGRVNRGCGRNCVAAIWEDDGLLRGWLWKQQPWLEEMVCEPKGSQLMLWLIYVNCNSAVTGGNELWIAIDLFASPRRAGELKCFVENWRRFCVDKREAWIPNPVWRWSGFAYDDLWVQSE
jgi:hypothetical protein